jgi:hypothetical protein
MNLQGKIIRTQHLFGGSEPFNIQNIAPGCYWLNIIEDNHRYSQKLIIE